MEKRGAISLRDALSMVLQVEKEGQARLEQARREADRIVAEAREEARRFLQETEETVSRERTEATEQAGREIGELASEIERQGRHERDRLRPLAERHREVAVARILAWLEEEP